MLVVVWVALSVWVVWGVGRVGWVWFGSSVCGGLVCLVGIFVRGFPADVVSAGVGSWGPLGGFPIRAGNVGLEENGCRNHLGSGRGVGLGRGLVRDSILAFVPL